MTPNDIMHWVLWDIERAAEKAYPPNGWEQGPRDAFVEQAVRQLVEKLVKLALEETP